TPAAGQHGQFTRKSSPRFWVVSHLVILQCELGHVVFSYARLNPGIRRPSSSARTITASARSPVLPRPTSGPSATTCRTRRGQQPKIPGPRARGGGERQHPERARGLP